MCHMNQRPTEHCLSDATSAVPCDISPVRNSITGYADCIACEFPSVLTEIMPEQEELLVRIKNFRLLDDDFMVKCFEDNIPGTELVLHIVLGNSDLCVKSVKTQYWIKNLQGRSVVLDIYAVDSTGKRYDIEIQRSSAEAGVRRARHNSSMVDANILKPGQEPKDLPDTYVIFITEKDVFGKGWPLYPIDRVISGSGDFFDDGSHIIYVNAECVDDTPLGKLMHDFSCTNADDMNYKILADRVRYFKEDKEGIRAMCESMEELANEVAQKATQRANLATAESLLKLGVNTLSDIARCTRLSLEEVTLLAQELKIFPS